LATRHWATVSPRASSTDIAALTVAPNKPLQCRASPGANALAVER
jgi:hypothetical protein